jgi:hypothetical protein
VEEEEEEGKGGKGEEEEEEEGKGGKGEEEEEKEEEEAYVKRIMEINPLIASTSQHNVVAQH